MNRSDELGSSYALGFWAKHAYAMDELYDYYEPDDPAGEPDLDSPKPLMDLWRSEHQGDLIEVFRAAELDRDRLLAACYEAVVTVFEAESIFKLQRRKLREDWALGAYARPTRQTLPQEKLWLTVWLNTVSNTDFALYVNLWVKGGKRASRTLVEVLDRVDDAREIGGQSWASGGVFLSKTNLSNHRDTGQVSVNLDSILGELKSNLKRQTPSRLERVLAELRKSG
jgi:hypothetical protein